MPPRTSSSYGGGLMSRLEKSFWWIPVLMAGCAAEMNGPGETVQLDQVNVYSIARSELTSSVLTTAKLDSASAATMGSTAVGRKALTFAVRCALSSTQTISFTVAGT